MQGANSTSPGGWKRLWQSGRWLLLAIVLCGAAVRLIGIGASSLWYDELYTVWASHLPLRPLVREALASGHPPLYYLVGHAWFALGSGPVWVRLISGLSGVLVIWLAYLTGKELFSRRAGLWAAALCAASPFLVWFSRDATAYSFLTLATLASFYFLVRAIGRGGWLNWLAYLAATAAALLTSYFSAFLLPAGWLAFLLLWRWKGDGPGQREELAIPENADGGGIAAAGLGSWRTLYAWAASQAVLVAVTLGVYLEGQKHTAPGWLALTDPSPRLVIKQLITSVHILFSGWVGDKGLDAADMLVFSTKRLVLVALLLCGFIAAAAVPSLRRRLINRKIIALMLATAVLVAGPVVIDSMMARPTASRFFVWAAPVFLLLIAGLLSAAPRRVAAVAGSLLIAAFCGFTWYELTYLHNTGDWQGVMGIISSQQQPGDRIECFPLHLCQVAESFYVDPPLPLAGGMASHAQDAIFFLNQGEPWTGYQSGYYGENGRMQLSGAGLESRIRTDVAGAGRIWLVLEDDEYGVIPSTPHIYRTLEAAGWTLVREFDLPPQVIRLYQAPGDGGAAPAGTSDRTAVPAPREG